ncbi:MAG: hypothetical protein IJR99_16665 [Kiritimatiellae bacterium]|nr:hypothetical protein [Kiritimatiellia bacterium]
MDKIWKWILKINAKVFCLACTVVFFLVAAWCGQMYLNPMQPFPEGKNALKEKASDFELRTLAFVSNELAQENITIPIDPFRPTMEAIFTNDEERAAFLAAYKAQQAAALAAAKAAAEGGAAGAAGAAGGAGGAAGNNAAAAAAAAEADKAKAAADPFAALRKKAQVPGQVVGPNGEKMVIPKITFLGFMERTDGSRVAVFSDSSDHSTHFYNAGGKVHGVEISDVSLKSASMKLPDGSTVKVGIGEPVSLSPEPMKKPAGQKVAATAAKGGKPQPNAAKGAAANDKAAKIRAMNNRKLAQQQQKRK